MYFFISILIDSALIIGKNYHQQAFLGGKKKVSRYINIDLEISFDDSDKGTSDEEAIS